MFSNVLIVMIQSNFDEIMKKKKNKNKKEKKKKKKKMMMMMMMMMTMTTTTMMMMMMMTSPCSNDNEIINENLWKQFEDVSFQSAHNSNQSLNDANNN